MAKIQDILSLQLQLQANPIAARNAADALTSEVGKAMGKISDDFQDSLKEAIELGVGNGFKGVDKMQKKFHDAAKPLIDAMVKAKELETEIGLLRAQTTNADAQAEARNKEARLAGLKVYADQHAKMLDVQLKGEQARITAGFDRRMKLAQEYNEHFAQSFEDRFEQAAEGMGDTLNDIVTLNLKDAFKKGGNYFSKMGAGMQAKGAATGSAGQAGLGQVLGGIGKSLAVIGAIAGGLAMLIKTLIDADSQMKEFNRDIINNVGALDTMGKGTKDVTEGLDEVRKAAIKATSAFNPLNTEMASGVSAVMHLGLTSKEYLSTLTKFAETGVTFDKMNEGVKGLSATTEKYTNYVKSASTYSRMFGEDLNGMAEKMGDMMMDLGMNLKEVKEGFSVIGDEAQKSGYGTKRFFNMVLQSTTGMQQYNVRLGATAKLLSQMTKILGMKQAGALFQTIEGKFKGESFQDRTKRILTTGKDVSKDILVKDAQIMANNFQKAMGNMKLDMTGMNDQVKKMYETLSGGSSKDIVDALSKASVKDRGLLVESLRAKDSKLAERLDALFQSSGAATGDLMKIAESMQNASSAAKLVLEKRRLEQVLHTDIKDMTLEQAMAYGVSVDEFEQMKKLSIAAQAQVDKGNALLEESKKLGEGSAEQRAFLEQANKQLAENNLKIEDGNLVSAATGEKIKTGDEQQLNWSKEAEKESEKLADQHMAYSEQTAENTYDLTNLVSESMISILETIGGYVRDILVLLGFKESDKELKDAVQKQTKANDEKMAAIDEEIKASRQQAEDLNKAIASGKLTVKQADEARAGVEAAKNFEKAKRQEQRDLRQQSRSASGLARGATEEQKELFNLVQGRHGGQAALQVVSGMSAEEAAEHKKDLDFRRQQGRGQGMVGADTASTVYNVATLGLGAVGGAIGGDIAAKDDFAKMLVEDKASNKHSKKTAEEQEKNRKLAEEANKIAQKQLDIAEQTQRDTDVTEMNKAFEKAGFGMNALRGGTKEDIAKQLKELAGSNPDAWKKAQEEFLGGKEKKYVQDALVTDNQVLVGGKDDVGILATKAGLASMSGGGGASVNIVINATQGLEHTVQSQVLAALKQYYGVTTGSTRSVQ